MQRRESRGGSGELGFEGMDQDFMQTVLARHFGNLNIRVSDLDLLGVLKEII